MKQNLILFLLSIFFVLFQTVFAVQEFEVKITADDGEEDDLFGRSVSISGDYAIIGAHGDDDNGSDAGSAYIFVRDDQDWVQQEKITADDGARRDNFGYSVSISGGYAVVGARYDNDNGENSGSAYIFVRDGEDWVQQQKIIADDGETGDRFGRSVSISGDYVIVGAFADDDNGETSGSAYIFVRNVEDWIQQDKIVADDGETNDHFGYSVSISGDYAIVGAFEDDDNGDRSGSAYIFVRDGEDWIQQDKITADDGAEGKQFGKSVPIGGDYAIAGAYCDYDNGYISGAAYIFIREGEDWIQQQKITADDGEARDAFGYSVSISGNYVIIGAKGDNDNGDRSGSAYIFVRDGEDWIQQQKITADDGEEGDNFGQSVSISGDYAIVGAFGDDDNGDASGSAYIYTFQEMLTEPNQPDFGEVPSYQQGVLDLDIIYLGVESAITITDISTGTDYFGSDFEDEIVVDPGDTARVQITFSPDAVREYSDTLTIATDNIYIGEKTVVLGGIGIEGDEVDINPFIPHPSAFILHPAYPNPFNSTTTIRYSLPYPSHVSLQIFNLSGQQITTLFDGYRQAGFHSTNLMANDLPAGVYLVRMKEEGGRMSQTRKIVLVK